MARRVRPPIHPVELKLDGESIVAERGEPIAFALIAADKLALSRSPKLHRPHGPSCLRGACDGCAARVNGEPNIMTCLIACRGGERVETQNVLGSRELDLMQVTDWFFPRGIDHHHFMAGVPAASFLVQKLARHVAGLGRLPELPRPAGNARREGPDVLVVGAGPAGIIVAKQLAMAGVGVVLVDEGVRPGGSWLARGNDVPDLAGLDVRSSATAAGIYERDVLVASENEVVLMRPRALVLATGAHDGAIAFAGNDLPGVLSARAASMLLMSGISVGKRVAVIGEGVYADAFIERSGNQVRVVRFAIDETLRAHGRSRITRISTGEAKEHKVDALLVEAPGAPAFELAEQAGARVAFDPTRGGYVPELDEGGRALDWVWCAGEVSGTGPALAAIEAQSLRVAEDVREKLGASPR